MNGPIAQAVALVCHGNAWLRGFEKATSLLPDNSTFQFCDRVEFVELRRKFLGRTARERLVASTPVHWFERLEEWGVEGLRLDSQTSGDQRLDDRLSEAFAGGGAEWSICSLSSWKSSRWIARWEVCRQNAPDNRIWRVTYGCVGAGRASSPARPQQLGTAADRVRDALDGIGPFARAHGLDVFADCFERARALLDGAATPDVYHEDLAPAGLLPPDAATLLAACQKAWVFGGMGSWNDLYFQGRDQETYDRTSDALYQAVTSAIVAATNASVG